MSFARRILCAPVVLLCFSTTALGRDVDSAEGERVTLEQAASAFDAAALRINDGRLARTARWTDRIYLAIAGYSGMRSVAPEIEAAVREVARTARVPVERVAFSDDRANMLFRPSAGDVGNVSGSSCRAAVSWTEGAMRRAEITVNLANESRITRCINHETMHAFGLRSHAHAALSVLSYSQTQLTRPSKIDHLMIETLYDARLHPGTEPVVATRLACAIMAEKLGASAAEKARHCEGRDLRAGGLLSSLRDRQ